MSFKIILEMQKITFTLMVLFLLIAGTTVKSQVISIPYGEFYVSGPASTVRLEARLQIQNSANSGTSIKVYCDKSQMVPGHQMSYCWALCYDSTVCIAPDALVVPGRGIDSISFHSYLYPNTIVGISTINYTFYDENNQTDTVNASIVFDALNTGIDEVKRGHLSAAYPNPASTITTLNYTLSNLSNGHIYMYNLLGVMVKDILLTSNQSLLAISVSDLNAGIYTYTLVNEGKIVSANRLVVTKN